MARSNKGSITKQRQSTNKYNRPDVKVHPLVWVVIGLFLAIVALTIGLSVPSNHTKLYDSYQSAAGSNVYKKLDTDEGDPFSEILKKEDLSFKTIKFKKLVKQINAGELLVVFTGSPTSNENFIKALPSINNEFNKLKVPEDFTGMKFDKGFVELGVSTIYNFQYKTEDFDDIFEKLRDDFDIRIKNSPQLIVINDKAEVEIIDLSDIDTTLYGTSNKESREFFYKVLEKLTTKQE